MQKIFLIFIFVSFGLFAQTPIELPEKYKEESAYYLVLGYLSSEMINFDSQAFYRVNNIDMSVKIVEEEGVLQEKLFVEIDFERSYCNNQKFYLEIYAGNCDDAVCLIQTLLQICAHKQFISNSFLK